MLGAAHKAGAARQGVWGEPHLDGQPGRPAPPTAAAGPAQRPGYSPFAQLLWPVKYRAVRQEAPAYQPWPACLPPITKHPSVHPDSQFKGHSGLGRAIRQGAPARAAPAPALAPAPASGRPPAPCCKRSRADRQAGPAPRPPAPNTHHTIHAQRASSFLLIVYIPSAWPARPGGPREGQAKPRRAGPRGHGNRRRGHGGRPPTRCASSCAAG